MKVAGPGDERAWCRLAASPTRGKLHIAFAAADRAAVDPFHRDALAAAGADSGWPAPRPHNDRDDYVAFFFDPDGQKVEAICRAISMAAEVLSPAPDYVWRRRSR